jgi:hypothetical protein
VGDVEGNVRWNVELQARTIEGQEVPRLHLVIEDDEGYLLYARASEPKARWDIPWDDFFKEEWDAGDISDPQLFQFLGRAKISRDDPEIYQLLRPNTNFQEEWYALRFQRKSGPDSALYMYDALVKSCAHVNEFQWNGLDLNFWSRNKDGWSSCGGQDLPSYGIRWSREESTGREWWRPPGGKKQPVPGTWSKKDFDEFWAPP